MTDSAAWKSSRDLFIFYTAAFFLEPRVAPGTTGTINFRC